MSSGTDDAGGFGGLFVGDGPRGTRRRAVIDPEPAAHPRDPVADALDPLHEYAVEYNGDGIGVLPQVDQLVVGVAVVGVDRDQADLVGGVAGLQVVGAVVEVESELVLFGHSGPEQPPAYVVGPLIELAPGPGVAPLDQSRRIGQLVGHGLPHISEVPLAHVYLLVPPGRLGHDRAHRLIRSDSTLTGATDSLDTKSPQGVPVGTGAAYAGPRGHRTAAR